MRCASPELIVSARSASISARSISETRGTFRPDSKSDSRASNLVSADAYASSSANWIRSAVDMLIARLHLRALPETRPWLGQRCSLWHIQHLQQRPRAQSPLLAGARYGLWPMMRPGAVSGATRAL
eukprot:2982046-Prymnesium_polylepis.1